jgi:hypothetical protein
MSSDTKAARYKAFSDWNEAYVETDKFCILWNEKRWDEIDYKGFYDPPHLYLNNFMTPLGISLSQEMIDMDLFKECLDRGTNPNDVCSDSGEVPLEILMGRISSYGLSYGSIEFYSFILKRLIYAGADIDSQKILEDLKTYHPVIRKMIEALIEDVMDNYINNPCALRFVAKNIGGTSAKTIWPDSMPLVIARLIFLELEDPNKVLRLWDEDYNIEVPVEGWDEDDVSVEGWEDVDQKTDILQRI